ncbi:MAG: isoamylase early set domain-containing protein [Roseiflexaceae bacterium]|nr:isoamylase early set domain-containing protein [Roseiflexaceae bacterium]
MIKKEYSKTGRSCKITLELPADVQAETASVCGEFNGWSQDSHPMKRRKDGTFSITFSVKPGSQYRFRYLLDGQRWENDWQADIYLPNDHGTEDSVLSV